MFPKPMRTLGLGALVVFIVAFFPLDNLASSALAVGLAPFSSYWDSYMFALVVPMVAIAKTLWNPFAGRAANPVTGRFVRTGTFVAIGILAVVAAFFFTTAL